MKELNLSHFQFDDESLNEAAVQYFVDRIRKGLRMPMPVINKDDDGYVVVDGRNRLEAAKRCGADSVAAYVLEESDPEKLVELRLMLNEQSRRMN